MSDTNKSSSASTTNNATPSLNVLESVTTSTAAKLPIQRLPWGALKEKHNLLLNLRNINALTNQEASSLANSGSLASLPAESSSLAVLRSSEPASAETQKPGEYLMQLVMLSFIQLTSKKFEQIVNGDKRDRRLKESLLKGEDLQLDQLVMAMGQVAEHCLPSLTRSLLMWHEHQLNNLNYLRQQQMLLHKQQVDAAQVANTNSKVILKIRQQLMQVKL